MHFIDRRLNPAGKSLENRQRFLRRAKALVREAVRKTSRERKVKDVLEGGEVSVPVGGLGEPRFRRGGGIRDMVLPGNTKYVEGDYLPRQGQGGGGSDNSGAGEGTAEDAFRFVLTREEFLDLFLDDLELPDQRAFAEAESDRPQRAGYTTSGSPSNISIGRTVRRAMTRRIALGRPRREEIALLESEAADKACAEERRAELRSEIEALKAKARRIPFIDPIDIRYRRFDPVPKPASQAVMFCLMDVSGSVTEHMKDLAKQFYMLLYVFLRRKYKRVEIVFIRHTDVAEEVDEQTFFHDPKTGGTKVSPAFEAMKDILDRRFVASEWNVYVAQASDGDSSYSEGEEILRLLRDVVLPAVQYFAYLEVGSPDTSDDHYGMHYSAESSLWGLYSKLVAEGAPLSMRKVSQRSEIFPVFRELFRRREGERG
jgi:uncharacterized sporulation protein YeaH/YhbH (DUF444 family)